MANRNISFPPKDLPLRDDVGTLGRMVGEVLREQCGEDLYAQVEAIRSSAIQRREEGAADLEPVERAIGEPDAMISRQLVRAFSTYFQVTNLAELVHRIRRIREVLHAGDELTGSLNAAFTELRASGISDAQLEPLLERLLIEPVMTAHPTEVTRRSLLEKERSIIKRLAERLDPGRTPDEERVALERIRQQITVAWQTRHHAAMRPSVATERAHILFYIAETLYEIVPVYYESMRRALDRHFPTVLQATPLPTILRFGSWVGGDMDGNPNVDHTTIRASLEEHRSRIIGRYIPDARHLARELSQSLSEVEVSAALQERIAHYCNILPDTAASIPQRYADMPYRAMFVYVAARLEKVLGGGEHENENEHAYATSEELLADLALVKGSLKENRGERAGLVQVERLIWRVRTFGFYLATLDIRQDAAELRAAVADLLGVEDWQQKNSSDRTAELSRLLQALPIVPANPGPELQRALDVFATVRECRELFGPDSIGSFIISMTQGADDVLTVMLLARVAGLAAPEHCLPLDIAPLLETVDDLGAGVRILAELAANQPYRAHLAERCDRQLIMIGYSDSNKDSGITAARWALQCAQRELTEFAEKEGIAIGFFHGRGGTVSRGGGNMVHGINAAPAGSVNALLRVTEQGEVIRQKYGIRPLALRNLEQITGATVTATLRKRPEESSQWSAVMADIAAVARTRYRGLVYDDERFEPYFRQATPIDVIERLAIGSRPSARRTKTGIHNLRAIPWVFSWAQTRLALPGSFGLGAGLTAAINKHGIDAVRDMLRWPFFSSLINDVEMVMAKSDLEIGEHYSQLADPELRPVFAEIDAESRCTETLILQIKDTDHLLSNDETLRRAIRLRNPYVDPLNLLQIRLLNEWRASNCEDDALLATLFETVNGIARGIQNTG